MFGKRPRPNASASQVSGGTEDIGCIATTDTSTAAVMYCSVSATGTCMIGSASLWTNPTHDMYGGAHVVRAGAYNNFFPTGHAHAG